MKRIILFLALVMTSISLKAQDYQKYHTQAQIGVGFVFVGVFAATGSEVFLDEPKQQRNIRIGAGVSALIGLAIWGNAPKRLIVTPNHISYRF